MHKTIDSWAENKGIQLGIETKQRFIGYIDLLFDTNKQFNLTGHKTEEEMLTNLVLGSLDPLCDINVPRGTSFVDIGSGAGVPGLAIGIFFKGATGLLIESSHKKADFIRRVAAELGLKNIEVMHDRAENIAGLEAYKEAYDWCFSRAMANMFITCEIGSPFVKQNGYLYIYSNETGNSLPEETIDHAGNIGLAFMTKSEMAELKLNGRGILFKKINPTPDKYPRAYAAIKRDADRIRPVAAIQADNND